MNGEDVLRGVRNLVHDYEREHGLERCSRDSGLEEAYDVLRREAQATSIKCHGLESEVKRLRRRGPNEFVARQNTTLKRRCLHLDEVIEGLKQDNSVLRFASVKPKPVVRGNERVLHQQLARLQHIRKSQVEVIQGQRDAMVEIDKAWMERTKNLGSGNHKVRPFGIAKAVGREPRW